ncbi:MAG: stage III sporulation protein AB [Eubacterium sp.]|nr:stage III sporulation protein AB [Eubacterium sp.]
MYSIFKIAGAALIEICFLILGEYFACRKELRGDQLTEIRLGIGFFRGDIEFNLTPAGVSAERTAEKLREPVCSIFKDFSKRLKTGESVERAWIRALTYNYDKTYLKAEDIEMLYPFGKITEYLDIEKQDKGIELLVGYIDSKVKELKADFAEAKRFYRSASVLTGLLAVVMLL